MFHKDQIFLEQIYCCGIQIGLGYSFGFESKTLNYTTGKTDIMIKMVNDFKNITSMLKPIVS